MKNVILYLYIIAYILVYVFVGSSGLLVELMRYMESLDFFENGDHMVVFINNEMHREKESDFYLGSMYAYTYFIIMTWEMYTFS